MVKPGKYDAIYIRTMKKKDGGSCFSWVHTYLSRSVVLS